MRPDLLAALAGHADRTALIHRGAEYSYAAISERARAALALLGERGVKPHESVVLQGDFDADSIALLLALFQNGNVIVPVVRPTDLVWQAIREQCAPAHFFDCRAGARYERLSGEAAASQPLVERLKAANASGLVLLSSGTTGRPKVILHDLDRIVSATLARRRKGRLTLILFLLFDHIGGLNTLLSSLCAGHTGIALDKRTPEEVCSLIERYRARILPTSPTFLTLMLLGDLTRQYDVSSLKLITYGTEPMPEPLLARIREAIPSARLLQTFGTSETGISSTVSESSRSTFFKIDDELFEHRVVDGELHLRSRTQFLGYLGEATDNVTEDGWFRTGDLVQRGDNGYFRIQGRRSEAINVGGEKVLPLEVESVLLTSPLVADCVVYGEPNALTGQHVCAEVKPRQALSRSELRAHVQQFLAARLAPFKVPARVVAVDQIRRSDRFKKVRVCK